MNRVIQKGSILFVLFILWSAPLPGRELSGFVLPLKEVVVSAATENTVRSIQVELGDTVAEGDLLAELDDRIHVLQTRRFKRVLEMSEATYRSTSQLGEENIISREEALKAEIERDLAHNQLEVSKVELSRQKIVSPLDGIVVEVLKDAGEMVKRAEEMFVIVNIDQVFLQVFMTAEEAYAMEPGDRVTVSFPEIPSQKEFTGNVYYIDPRIDANSGMLRTRVLIENPDHAIRSGMRGFLKLQE